METLVSIIVPVYNVRECLDECLESIVRQTYSNLEIILIDDGSTDGSEIKCEEWHLKDKRIQVLHQKNGGLSAARNAGLNICRGEWIVFVDSDDILPEDSVELLLELVIEKNAMIGQGNFVTLDKKATIEKVTIEEANPEEVFEGKDFLKSKLFVTMAWGKIYHRAVWENRRFRSGIIYEDYDIMYRVMYETTRVGFTSKLVYCVREREGSITRSRFSAERLILIDIDERKILYFQEKEDGYLLEQAYQSYYSNLLHLYKMSGMQDIVRKYRKNFKHFIQLKNIGFRTKVKLTVCYFFPGMWERNIEETERTAERQGDRDIS